MSDEWIEATIEKLVTGGEGLARIDGMAHFVPGVLPGEKVRAKVLTRKKAWARTDIPEILEKSPHRREAFCPLYGECGGCSWQHIDYDFQLESKTSFCLDALERQGGMSSEEIPDIAVFPSPPQGYRARIRPIILPDGRPGFRAAGSDRVVPIPHCPIANEEINQFLANPPGALKPGSEPVVFGSGGHFRVEGMHKRAEALVGGREFRFPPSAFFQSNLSILEKLVEFSLPKKTEGDESRRKGAALDLYGGVGLFGAFLSDLFESVVGVDRDRTTQSGWERHVGDTGHFYGTSLEKWIVRKDRIQPAFVVVDPPRGGLDAVVRRGLIEMASPEMTYVSCDPVTQARDLSEFLQAGYRLEAYGLFDLYPQTAHVETVARLRLETPR